MFPMRFSTIFKSRWMAVLWAAGILWFAYDVAGSQPQDANASSVNGDDNQLAAELNSF